jgi:hypothetical protein
VQSRTIPNQIRENHPNKDKSLHKRKLNKVHIIKGKNKKAQSDMKGI